MEKNIFKNSSKSRFGASTIFFGVFIALFLAVVVNSFVSERGTGTVVRAEPVELSFSDVLRRADEIQTMRVRGDTATGKLSDGTEYRATVAYSPEMLEKFADRGTAVSIDTSKGWVDYLGVWVPIIMGVLFIWWLFRGMRSGGGLGRALVGQNPTKVITGKPKTTFKDVAGIDSEKQELAEVVDFLRDKSKFAAVGARVPRGVLLSGEPGTGKTLLARAIAGEANVPFFAASGSDFSGIIVGLGVAKIKDIFEMAKRNAPCLLFIDEIDAIGQRRSQNSFNDQDREQTLNQLLIEMDGFSNETGIIVIGATNRPDMLDPALLRPGRFDRQVHIDLPDMAGREEILKLHAKKIKMHEDVDLGKLARGTTGLSGADLENLLNEAALHAVRSGRKLVAGEDIEEARDKSLMGPRKVRKMRPQDIKMTAYHEAGHAFASTAFAGLADPIHKATIVPRGRALGMVQHLPIDDKVSMSLAEIKADLVIDLAGRASEEVFFGADKITTGAEADIAVATQLARRSITTAGMSNKIGMVAINQVQTFGSRVPLEAASEKTAELVDAEIKSWIDAAHADAVKIITRNKATVEKLANELLRRETLTGDEIMEIVSGKKTAKKVAAKKVAKTKKARVAKK